MGSGFGWGGLRGKIIAWFLIPTAIILAIVALFTFGTYQRVTEDLVVERNQEVARLLASQVAAGMDDYTTQLGALMATADVYAFRSDPLTQKPIIRFSTDRFVEFDGGVLILDEFGNVMAADQRRLDAIGQDWSDRAFYQQAVETVGPVPEPIFSDIGADGPQGTDAIVIAVPARDSQGEFRGMSVGLFRLSSGMETASNSFTTSLLRELGGVETDSVYMIDRNGRAIYHSDAQLIGEHLAMDAVVQEALAGNPGGLRTRNSDGREIVASFAPVPGTGWILVTEESWAALTSSSQRYGQLLLLLLGLGVVVPALVIGLGARRITRPIAELTSAAQQMARGNFSQTIAVPTGDELEGLAEQFNRMSAQLQESYATLEQRVADRTRELAILNSIAAIVSRSLDLEEILGDALDKTIEIVAMDVSAAYRLEEDGQHLTLIAHRGLSEEFVRHVTRLPLWVTAAGMAARSERPIIMELPDYPESELKESLKREGLQTAVSIPLTAKGRIVGAITLASRAVPDMMPEELSLLAAIGQQTGMAVENARLYEQAEETAVAAERNRLARDLHDAVTQTLFSAGLIADVLPRLWDRRPDEARRRLEELRQLTRGALAEMRTLLVELRPAALDEVPLMDLLRQLGEATTGRARVPVTLEVEGECRLPPDVKVVLYRIAQEALNNVGKHANASQVVVRLRCEEGRVELLIRDDGQGFDPSDVSPDHLGLGIMRERVLAVSAELSVESKIGHGTEIRAVWSS